MISVNEYNIPLEINKDKEQGFQFSKQLIIDLQEKEVANVVWHYKDDSEFLPLIAVIQKLKEYVRNTNLYIPYLPYASLNSSKEMFQAVYYIVEYLETKLYLRDTTIDSSKMLPSHKEEFTMMCKLLSYLPKDSVIVYTHTDLHKKYHRHFSLRPYVATNKTHLFNVNNINLNDKTLILVDIDTSSGEQFLNSYDIICKKFTPKEFYCVSAHMSEQIVESKLLKHKDFKALLAAYGKEEDICHPKIKRIFDDYIYTFYKGY